MTSLLTPALKKIALLVALAAPALSLAANYGAIAYSPSTGKYGKSRNCPSRAQAERAAIADCGTIAPGMRADLLLVDDRDETLPMVRATIVEGRLRFASDSPRLN